MREIRKGVLVIAVMMQPKPPKRKSAGAVADFFVEFVVWNLIEKPTQGEAMERTADFISIVIIIMCLLEGVGWAVGGK